MARSIATPPCVRTKEDVCELRILTKNVIMPNDRAAKGLLAFTRLVRANLMHRRPIDRLLDLPPPIPQDQRQFLLRRLPILNRTAVISRRLCAPANCPYKSATN
jgi:hypothetical protein